MTFSEQLIAVLDALFAKFGIVVDWASENVLPYLETLCGKLITYEIATSIGWIVFVIVITASLAIVAKKFYVKFQDDEYTWEIPFIFSMAGLVISILVSIICVAVQVGDIIKCVTFPEMYVIEYVQDLISK